LAIAKFHRFVIPHKHEAEEEIGDNEEQDAEANLPKGTFIGLVVSVELVTSFENVSLPPSVMLLDLFLSLSRRWWSLSCGACRNGRLVSGISKRRGHCARVVLFEDKSVEIQGVDCDSELG